MFYTEGNELLANIMQDSFVSYLNSPLKEKKVSNDIYMYNKLKVPGLLIECGFLSNSNERNLLKSDDYQYKIVNSIVKALIKYY